MVDKLNERFGTNFTKVDHLFFDQIEASARQGGKIVEAVFANKFDNFEAFFAGILDELVFNRMDGNEDIASRFMTDETFGDLTKKALGSKSVQSCKAFERALDLHLAGPIGGPSRHYLGKLLVFNVKWWT